jgi:hypothetical protein
MFFRGRHMVLERLGRKRDFDKIRESGCVPWRGYLRLFGGELQCGTRFRTWVQWNINDG